MTRRRWTPAQKQEVRDRQDGLCACGCARPLKGRKIEYNHVRALCLGGADELWNIEALIDECHKPHTKEVVQRKSKADRQGGRRGSQYQRRKLHGPSLKSRKTNWPKRAFDKRVKEK